MALMSVDAQSTPELPRLVVNILVDQLRTDYMEAFAPLYGEDGLKRLMRDARYYADTQQPFSGADRASAAACLSTGAIPYDNGVPSLQGLFAPATPPLLFFKPYNFICNSLGFLFVVGYHDGGEAQIFLALT